MVPNVELTFREDYARISLDGKRGGEFRIGNENCSATMGYERGLMEKEVRSPFVQITREVDENERLSWINPAAYMRLDEIGLSDSRSRAAMTIGDGKADIWSDNNYWSRFPGRQ